MTLYPSSPGIRIVAKENSILDYSNVHEGYFSVRHNGKPDLKAQIRIGKDKDNIQNFTVMPDGVVRYFPLCYGSGTYQLILLQELPNRSGKAEGLILIRVDVKLNSPLIPWLYPNVYTHYNHDSVCVKTASKICAGILTDTGKISAVHTWIADNIKYDTDLARTVNSTPRWLPDPDEVIAKGKCICFGYSSLMAAMLRSQGISCKVNVGRTNGVKHAWNEVWTADAGDVEGIPIKANAWTRLDVTTMSVSSRSAKDFVVDDERYLYEYCG